MELETNRLFIRPFQESDWSRLYDYARQTAVMHYIPGGALDKQGAKAFVRTNSGNNAKAFAVIEKHSDSLIGHIDFLITLAAIRMRLVGYSIQNGKGEALRQKLHKLV